MTMHRHDLIPGELYEVVSGPASHGFMPRTRIAVRRDHDGDWHAFSWPPSDDQGVLVSRHKPDAFNNLLDCLKPTHELDSFGILKVTLRAFLLASFASGSLHGSKLPDRLRELELCCDQGELEALFHEVMRGVEVTDLLTQWRAP
jgi:hypothetical protein